MSIFNNDKYFFEMVLFRKRAIIETINDELKNIAQIEHSRHRSFHDFVVNLLSGIAAYCFFPKKPSINLEKVVDKQLTLLTSIYHKININSYICILYDMLSVW